WRTKFFVKYYFVTGIGAGVISVLVSLLPFTPLSVTYDLHPIVGASGALFGLLLAYAYYFPERPILMFLLFPVPAKIFVAILGAIAFIQAFEVNGGVAATTHLGGMLVGYIYLQGGRGGWTAEIKYRYLKWKMNRMRRKFDVYSGGRSEKTGWDRRVHWYPGPGLNPLCLLPVKVRVRVIQPVLADRREDIQLERVIERLGLMLDP